MEKDIQADITAAALIAWRNTVVEEAGPENFVISTGRTKSRF